jgi:hypothetical protein
MPLHTKKEQAKNKAAAKVDGKTGPAKTVRGTANRRISDIQKEIDRLTKTKKKLMGSK